MPLDYDSLSDEEILKRLEELSSNPTPPLQPESYDDIIKEAATAEGVPEELVRAVIHQESGGKPSAVSPVGAQGLMQLMPETAKSVGVEDSFNPEENIRGGTKYLAQMLKQFGDVDKAIAAYNAGPGAVQKYGGIPPFKETKKYVPAVLSKYQELQDSLSDDEILARLKDYGVDPNQTAAQPVQQNTSEMPVKGINDVQPQGLLDVIKGIPAKTKEKGVGGNLSNIVLSSLFPGQRVAEGVQALLAGGTKQYTGPGRVAAAIAGDEQVAAGKEVLGKHGIAGELNQASDPLSALYNKLTGGDLQKELSSKIPEKVKSGAGEFVAETVLDPTSYLPGIGLFSGVGKKTAKAALLPADEIEMLSQSSKLSTQIIPENYKKITDIFDAKDISHLPSELRPISELTTGKGMSSARALLSPLTTYNNDLKKMGEVGHELIMRPIQAANLRKDIAGRLIDDTEKIFKGIKHEEVPALYKAVDALESDQNLFATLPEHLRLSANKIRHLTNATGDMLVKEGLIKDKLPNYIPRVWDRDGHKALQKFFSDEANTVKVADSLVNKGIYPNRISASTSLQQWLRINAWNKESFEYGRTLPFTLNEMEKLGIPLPKMDAKVLTDHFEGVAQRISEARFFGNGGKGEPIILDNLLDRLKQEFGPSSPEFTTAKNYTDRLLNGVHHGRLANLARAMGGFALSPSTTMLQEGQHLLQSSIASTKQFLQSSAKAMTEIGRTAAKRGGAVVGNKEFLKLMQADEGVDSVLQKALSGYLNLIGTKKVDNWARTAAFNLGDRLATDNFKLLLNDSGNKIARNFFKDYALGFDIDKALTRGHLLPFEKRTVARMVDKDFNFWLLPGELPKVILTDAGSVFGQFMGPAYLESTLIKKLILNYGIRNKDPWFMLKLPIAMAVAGELHGAASDIQSMRSPIENEYRTFKDKAGEITPQSVLSRLGESATLHGPGVGLISNLAEAPKFGSMSNPLKLSPTGGSIQKVGGVIEKNINRLREGESPRLGLTELNQLLSVPSLATPSILTRPLRALLKPSIEEEQSERRKKKTSITRKRPYVSPYSL